MKANNRGIFKQCDWKKKTNKAEENNPGFTIRNSLLQIKVFSWKVCTLQSIN